MACCSSGLGAATSCGLSDGERDNVDGENDGDEVVVVVVGVTVVNMMIGLGRVDCISSITVWCYCSYVPSHLIPYRKYSTFDSFNIIRA
jgi:hypothetical protein